MPDTPHPREVLGDAWACLGGSAQTLVTQAGSVRLPWAVEQGRAGQLPCRSQLPSCPEDPPFPWRTQVAPNDPALSALGLGLFIS